MKILLEDGYFKWLLSAMAGVLLIKVLAMQFVQITDSDAVSRIAIAKEWTNSPHLITSGIWGPIHYYLLGIPLLFWKDVVYCPMLVTILFSVATMLPVFLFVRQLTSSSWGAFWAAILLAACPILFRNSFLPLSETPFLFFVACCLVFLSYGLSRNSLLYWALAGVSITIAAGLRYEAWLLMAILFTLIAIVCSFRAALVFGIAAGMFPLFWMYQGYTQTGNFLHGISGNYEYIELSGYNNAVDWEQYLRRIIFLPVVSFIAIGPVTTWLVAKAILRQRLHLTAFFRDNRNFFWVVPCWVLAAFIEYNAITGSLFLQSRFVGTILLLGSPLPAYLFRKEAGYKLPLTATLAVFGLGFVWSGYNAHPFPRISAKAMEISAIINSNVEKQTTVVLDFWDWEDTYFVALQSYSKLDSFPLIVSDIAGSGWALEKMKSKLRSQNQVVIALRSGSSLSERANIKNGQLFIEGHETALKTQRLYEQEGLTILKAANSP